MTAELCAIYTSLPDLFPSRHDLEYAPDPDGLTHWLGRRANNEWKAMQTSQAIIKAARDAMRRKLAVVAGRGA